MTELVARHFDAARARAEVIGVLSGLTGWLSAHLVLAAHAPRWDWQEALLTITSLVSAVVATGSGVATLAKWARGLRERYERWRAGPPHKIVTPGSPGWRRPK